MTMQRSQVAYLLPKKYDTRHFDCGVRVAVHGASSLVSTVGGHRSVCSQTVWEHVRSINQ